MLKVLILGIFIGFGFVTVPAQQPPPAPVSVPLESGAWTNVTPAKAGFTILLPGKPSETAQPSSRPGIEYHLLTLETKLAGYVVSYVQFPDEVTDPAVIKGLLDRGRAGGVASSGGTLKSEKEIKLNDYLGREWLMELPGGLTATARAYWVKRTLYQTIFVTTPKSDDSAEVKRLRQETASKFLNSFTLKTEPGN
ncbi:MAG: hypothetical protein ABR557_02280 [Pyrinomonadaceae bacterium]